MIHLQHFDATHIAVHAPYQHKDAIKQLADWPDVRWDGATKCWLCHARLYDKLAAALGADFAPLAYEFFCGLPAPDAPLPARDMYAVAAAKEAKLRKAKYSQNARRTTQKPVAAR